MARAARSSRFETRTARRRVKAYHEPYWIGIGKALYLGYRKGKTGGSWIARAYVDGQYKKRKLGNADDYQDANNLDILDYFQAQERVRSFASELVRAKYGEISEPITVAEAISNYLEWYKLNRKSYAKVKSSADAHIIPALGTYLLKDLTTKIIRVWHEELTKSPPRLKSIKGAAIKYAPMPDTHDARRSRRATANRILTILKAALNRAWADGCVASDDAWRRIKPFHNVEAPKIRYLNVAESIRLINACEVNFRKLVRAALLTGCRYGELIKLTANDFDKSLKTLHIQNTKNGKSRVIPLTDEGAALFKRLTLGKLGSKFILIRHDGKPWDTSHQIRRLKDACKIAKIEPAISFHILRHTYASFLASKGVSLQVIAELLGHSDTRITSRHYAHLAPSYVSEMLRSHLPNFAGNVSDKVVGI